MKKNKYNFGRIKCLLFLIFFLFSYIQLGFIMFSQEANAEFEHKELEIQRLQETIILQSNNFKAIDIDFEEGKELEIIFALKVKDDLPIDIWFVNEDNYLLLSGGDQFLFFIDGSQQQVSYAKKIVTLTEHDNYKLVMTNYYSNQTVEIDIVGELRTYGLESSEKSSENENSFTSLLFYPFLIAVIILGTTVVFLFIKIRESREVNFNHSNNSNPKKSKGNKSKKEKHKSSSKANSKKSRSKSKKSTKPEITLITSTKKSKSKASDTNHSYCGHCGKPITTPFCTSCGQVAEAPVVTVQ